MKSDRIEARILREIRNKTNVSLLDAKAALDFVIRQGPTLPADVPEEEWVSTLVSRMVGLFQSYVSGPSIFRIHLSLLKLEENVQRLERHMDRFLYPPGPQVWFGHEVSPFAHPSRPWWETTDQKGWSDFSIGGRGGNSGFAIRKGGEYGLDLRKNHDDPSSPCLDVSRWLEDGSAERIRTIVLEKGWGFREACEQLLEWTDSEFPLPSPVPACGQVWIWPDEEGRVREQSMVVSVKKVTICGERVIRDEIVISFVEGTFYQSENWPPTGALLAAGPGAPWQKTEKEPT
jgi:hypothetical protein